MSRTGGLGHTSERAVFPLQQELIGCVCRRLAASGERCTLNEVEIEPAVAVEVGERDSGPHVFRHVLLASAEVAVSKRDAELFGGVVEVRRSTLRVARIAGPEQGDQEPCHQRRG